VRSNPAIRSRLRVPPSLAAAVALCVTALIAAWGTIALSGTKIGVALALAVVLGPAAAYAAVTVPLIFPFSLFTIAVPFDNLLEFHSFGTLTKLIGVMCGVAMLLWIVRTKRYVTPDRSLVAWLAFVVLAICSFSWAQDPKSGVIDVTTLSSLFILLATVSLMPINARMLRLVSATVIAGGALAGIYGAYLFHRGGPSATADAGRLVVELGKQSIDPNHFAASLLLPSALVLVGLVENRGTVARFMLALCGLVIAAGLLLAASRGGIVAALAMYLYMLVRSRRKAVLAGIGVAALTIGLGAFSNIARRFSEAAATGGAGRLGIWKVGLAAFKLHPIFGAGLGNFAIAYNQAFLSVPAFATMQVIEGAHWSIAPHNNLVWIGVELGAVGVIVYLTAWWLSFRSLKSIEATSDLYPMRVAMEASLVGLFVAGLFLGTVTYKYVWLAFMLTALTRNAALSERREH